MGWGMGKIGEYDVDAVGTPAIPDEKIDVGNNDVVNEQPVKPVINTMSAHVGVRRGPAWQHAV